MPTKGEEMFFSAYVCVLVMVTAAWALYFVYSNSSHMPIYRSRNGVVQFSLNLHVSCVNIARKYYSLNILLLLLFIFLFFFHFLDSFSFWGVGGGE